jgi:hypothetical protein
MAASTAVKAGLISGGAGLVLILGAFAVTSTMAGAQTPSPTPGAEQQQTTPAAPNDGTQTTPKGDHQQGDCPGMDGSGGGQRGQQPGSSGTTDDGSTSPGTSFRGARGGGPRI